MHSEFTTFWNYLKTNRVKIPIIQRDYAQGRDDKSEVRKRFLKSLKGAFAPVLQNKLPKRPSLFSRLRKSYGKKNLIRLPMGRFIRKRHGIRQKLPLTKDITLDFIYGVSSGNVIQPLDGQQRLTTLWLLHWYVAAKAGKTGPKTDVSNVLKNFSYETRCSSRDFCEKLAEFQPDFSHPENISEQIKNQTWFNSAWTQDPTISGMLRMLSGDEQNTGEDSIEAVFGSLKSGKIHWNQLTAGTEKCPIRFYTFAMGAYGLTDDLYIKMNARGEQLTSCENFKADLIGYKKRQQGGYREAIDFAAQWDNAWTDIFWESKSTASHIDEIYFAFINRFFLGEFLGVRDEIKDEKDKRYIYLTDDYIAYQSLEIYKFSSDEKFKDVIDKLKNVLNAFHKYFKESKKSDASLKPNDLIPACQWDKQFRFIPEYSDPTRDGFGKDALKITPISQWQRVAFFAICKFFSDIQDNAQLETRLKRWMRVVWNLVSVEDAGGGAAISNIDTMRTAIRVIDKLDSKNIYMFLRNCNLEDPEWDGFDKNSKLMSQLQEEIEKAKKILVAEPSSDLRCYDGVQFDDDKWEEVIKKAENHAFFRGAIRFLFTNAEGKVDWEDFDTKWSNMLAYFDNHGVKEEYRANAKLLRAFLARKKCIDKDFWFGNGRGFWRNNVLLSNTPEHLQIVAELLAERVTDFNLLPQTAETNLPEWIRDETLIHDAILGDGDANRDKNWHILENWHSAKVLTRYSKCESRNIASPWQVIPLLHDDEQSRPLVPFLDGMESPERRGKKYFIGWEKDITFKYSGHWFRWLGAPKDDECDVYLLEEDSQSGERERPTGIDVANDSEKKDAKNFYCFDVKDINAVGFQNELDKLIESFEKDERVKLNSSETQAAVPPAESSEMTS